MKQREKLLGLGLLATLGMAWGADTIQSTWGTLASPIQSELITTAETLAQLEQDLEVARERVERLDLLRCQSLPSDPALAGILYQELLVHMIEEAGIDSPAINIASPIPVEDTGHRLQFTIQLKSDIEQLGNFLDQFESSNVLHQVKQLQIQQADGPESGHCNVTVVVEALALETAEGVSLEVAKSQKPRGAVLRQLANSELFRKPSNVVQTSSELSISSLLSMLQPKSNELTENIEPAEAQAPSNFVSSVPVAVRPQLVGIIGQGENKTALVYKSPGDKPVVLAKNSSLAPLGLTGLIQNISGDSILISKEQLEITVRLGDYLDF